MSTVDVLWVETGNFTDRPHAGRPRKRMPREDRLISRRTRQRPFSTAGALRGNLAFGGHIITRTVIRRFPYQTNRKWNLKLYTQKISFRSQAQMLKSTRGTLHTLSYTHKKNQPIWNKFIIRKDIIETSQVVLNFCRTLYISKRTWMNAYLAMTRPKGSCKVLSSIASTVVCKSLTLTLEGCWRGVYSVPS
jgi:hypothetical protein